MLRLNGSAWERGRAQASAAAEQISDVRFAVRMRLGRAESSGHCTPITRAFIEEQMQLTRLLVPEALDEIAGLADGFGLSDLELFAYLHLGTIADLVHRPSAQVDGCSSWAVASGPDGPLVVKNRDFRGEHLGLQRVFLHADPEWGGRRVICVGSLGSPGVYSSGMNSDGLALVDTQVATADHAPGVLRYFLMTRLLSTCATVRKALEAIGALPHAGGGTLVLADPSGAIAAVELGASVQVPEHGEGWVARTNHFISQELADTTIADPDAPVVGGSEHRLAALQGRLPGHAWTVAEARRLMSEHDDRGAFCRHGQDGDSRTISNVVFACAARMLHFTEGFPCTGKSEVLAFGQ